MKRCTTCGETKPHEEFHKQARNKDGYCDWCKPCKSIKKREEYLVNREVALARAAAYRKKHPEKVALAKKKARLKKIEQYAEKARAHYDENRDRILAYCAKRRKEKRAHILAANTKYKRERLRADPLYRLQYAMRNRTFIAFRDKGFSKYGKTAEIIGCDWASLMRHMEDRFTPGMTIDNYGLWHVDHVVPLSSAKSEDELVALCHYTNLQPLWAADNISKGAKMPDQIAA